MSGTNSGALAAHASTATIQRRKRCFWWQMFIVVPSAFMLEVERAASFSQG
jgi:hypothetical protein